MKARPIHFPSVFRALERLAVPLICVLTIHLGPAAGWVHAQSANGDIRIRYDDKRIDIKANNRELKRVLIKLADIAKIRIEYPASMKKKISINKRGLSLRETLERLLKDFNHILVYSGPSKLKASISRVVVFSREQKARSLTARQRRIDMRIKSYQRQLEALKKRLAAVDANSNRGKRYRRRITSIERSIERLQR